MKEVLRKRSATEYCVGVKTLDVSRRICWAPLAVAPMTDARLETTNISKRGVRDMFSSVQTTIEVARAPRILVALALASTP